MYVGKGYLFFEFSVDVIRKNSGTGSIQVIGVHALVTKGQLISKGYFIVFNSPKNELENVNFCPIQPTGAETFVRFLG